MNTAGHSTKQWNRHNGSNIIVRCVPRLLLFAVIMVVAILWVYLCIESSDHYGHTDPQTTPSYIMSFKNTNKEEVEDQLSKLTVLPRDTDKKIDEVPNQAIPAKVAEIKDGRELSKDSTNIDGVKEEHNVTPLEKPVITDLRVPIHETVEEGLQVKRPLKVSNTVEEAARVKEPPNITNNVEAAGKVKEPLNVATNQRVPEVVRANEPPNVSNIVVDDPVMGDDPKLGHILKKAALRGKTVIVTALNEAWAEPGSVFDLLLESFRVGVQTRKLLKHLVVITLDRKAYDRCLTLRLHCYPLDTSGNNFSGDVVFMTSEYLHLVWKKIEVLGTILRVGYNFLFTDADILWFRNPMKHLRKDADIQMSCDFFNGNASDLMMNFPNSGFQFVRSNNRTIEFYKFWHWSRKSYPGFKSQDVLNEIKSQPQFHKRRLRFRFLDTALFDGFCSAKLEFDKICTMHANCCIGLENKVHDLKAILDDWKRYMSIQSMPEKSNLQYTWTTIQRCRKSPEIEEAERLLKESQATLT